MNESKEQITIRLASTKDLKIVDTINRQCLPENYDMELWEVLIKYGFICVATINNADIFDKIVGYIAVAHLSLFGVDEKSATQTYVESHGDDCLCIVSLATLPEFRGQGVGSKLLQLVMTDRFNKERRNHILNVRISNNAAIKLYEKNGFVRFGDPDVGYYDNPTEDGLLLCKINK